MTHDELTAAVAASERLAPTSAERHGCYAARKPRPTHRPDPVAVWRRTRLSRGTNAQPTLAGVESHPRVHASGGEEAGCDGCPPTPTQRCINCGRRWGDSFHDRTLTGENAWDGDLCPTCAWDADCDRGAHGWNHDPVLCAVPGTGGRRHV